MSTSKPPQIAKYLKAKKNVLVLTGSLCDEVDFNGRKLLDYAAEVAQKIGAPIAATGNTIRGLSEKGAKAKKMWAMEVINYLRYPWQDSVTERKPEALVFIGYSPAVVQSLVSMMPDTDSVVLGNTYVAGATYSFPDASLRQWQKNLEQLIQAIGGGKP